MWLGNAMRLRSLLRPSPRLLSSVGFLETLRSSRAFLNCVQSNEAFVLQPWLKPLQFDP